MPPVAVALVLGAAVAHASWNVVLKRSGAGGARFLWLAALLAVVLWAPLAVGFALTSRATLAATVLAVTVSGGLHLAYSLMLQAGYRAGDLSLVYPLARGTGPLVAVSVAVLVRGERPTVAALTGGGLVVLGLFALARGHVADARRAVGFAVGTGIAIAGYTLWDKWAVDDLDVAAVVVSWGTDLTRAAVLTPMALGDRPRLRALVRDHLRDAVLVAVLSPLAYVLVLVALATTDVSFVAPGREVSVVVGVVLGRVLLGETVGRRRLVAAAGVAAGVAVLALA